jgi:hypothetical protein
MRLFTIISKWFWLFFIVVSFINAVIFQLRAKEQTRRRPELAEGYHKIIRGFITWGNLPWIIMGVGIMLGGVPGIFEYFRPADGNPYVIAFYGSVFFVWILGTYWIFIKKGAEMLVSHPGLFNRDFSSPTAVKLIWLLMVAAGIAAVVMFYSGFPSILS